MSHGIGAPSIRCTRLDLVINNRVVVLTVSYRIALLNSKVDCFGGWDLTPVQYHRA